MLYKQLIELFDILDSASASGAQVVEYLRSIVPTARWRLTRWRDPRATQIWCGS